MTKFPCDYCGGRGADFQSEEVQNAMTIGVYRPPVALGLETWRIKYLTIGDVTVCPWCLKKVFDTVLKEKK